MRCRLHPAVCVCAHIPQLGLGTEVVLVLHYREQRKTTNTGHLAHKALTRSRLLTHGDREAEPAPGAWVPPGRTGLVLTPSEDATVLTAAHADAGPVTLIVPDGNWRQASKMPRRIPGLRDLPRVVLPRGAPSRYRLRQEPKAEGLSTLEAIARALGILEGLTVQRQLEALLEHLVAATLGTRGQATA